MITKLYSFPIRDTEKQNKKNEPRAVKIDRLDQEIKWYIYIHIDTHTYIHTNIF